MAESKHKLKSRASWMGNIIRNTFAQGLDAVRKPTLTDTTNTPSPKRHRHSQSIRNTISFIKARLPRRSLDVTPPEPASFGFPLERMAPIVLPSPLMELPPAQAYEHPKRDSVISVKQDWPLVESVHTAETKEKVIPAICDDLKERQSAIEEHTDDPAAEPPRTTQTTPRQSDDVFQDSGPPSPIKSIRLPLRPKTPQTPHSRVSDTGSPRSRKTPRPRGRPHYRTPRSVPNMTAAILRERTADFPIIPPLQSTLAQSKSCSLLHDETGITPIRLHPRLTLRDSPSSTPSIFSIHDGSPSSLIGAFYGTHNRLSLLSDDSDELALLFD